MHVSSLPPSPSPPPSSRREAHFLDRSVGGEAPNSRSRRQVQPRSLSTRVQEVAVAGEGQRARGPPNRDDAFEMEGTTKGVEQDWVKFGQNT